MRPYSLDLRERVIARYEQGGITREAVAAEFSVSVRTVGALLKLKRETGGCAPKPRSGGPRFLLDEAARQRLKELVLARPDATLFELREQLGMPVCIMTVQRALHRMRARYKKKPSRQ